MNTLKCSQCKLIKPIQEFSVSKNSYRGYDYRCKQCNRTRALFYHSENREELLKKWKEQRASRTPEEREFYKLKLQERYWSDIRKKMFYAAMGRARKKNIEFTITIEDIVIPEKCPLLGVSFQKGVYNDKKYTYSLDKIDNEKGYVQGNIQVITYLANTMKNSASKEELKTFCTNMLKLLEEKQI